jgi:hypothetical protein
MSPLFLQIKNPFPQKEVANQVPLTIKPYHRSNDERPESMVAFASFIKKTSSRGKRR